MQAIINNNDDTGAAYKDDTLAEYTELNRCKLDDRQLYDVDVNVPDEQEVTSHQHVRSFRGSAGVVVVDPVPGIGGAEELAV
jgi:hypothetical protein